MGFMVGRGQNPARHVERMTGVILHEENSASNSVSESALGPVSGSVSEMESPARGETPAAPPPAPGAGQGNSTAAGAVFDPLKFPEGEALDAWGARTGASGRSGTKAEEKPAMPAERGPRFNWVFQMAVFRDKSDADKTRMRLERAGYRASLAKSGKVTLVLTHLRGGETDAARLREQAREMGLGEPLLLSKKPEAAKKVKQ
jgi:hypothetical protein